MCFMSYIANLSVVYTVHFRPRMIFFVRIKLFTLSRGRKSKFTTDRFIFIRSLNIVVDMYLIHLYKITVSLIVYFTSNYLHNIEASLPIYKLSLT